MPLAGSRSGCGRGEFRVEAPSLCRAHNTRWGGDLPNGKPGDEALHNGGANRSGSLHQTVATWTTCRTVVKHRSLAQRTDHDEPRDLVFERLATMSTPSTSGTITALVS
jgi:hypothetical protein